MAKADREALPAVRIRTRTVALRLDSLADTSVLIRVPVAAEKPAPVRRRRCSSPAARRSPASPWSAS